ncbi:MAG: tetratricopeptide repeat protein [Candidatus Hodarchaeota archaeon]
MSSVNYPPEEILKKKNFEHIILWMLNNNEECEWSHFTQGSAQFQLSTLSKYLTMLKSKQYVDNYTRGHYRITSEGKKRFHEISRATGEKRKLSYPPAAILRRRNYDHWILWMVYNNNFCKWADFIEEPLSINQSSLSKNINLLMDKEFVIKENKEYRITRSGKLEYSRMLRDYDLDRQSILDEESKRIEDITKKTIQFFDKYNIQDENIQFRFLNNILRLDYNRVKSMLSNEEDFDKIILFISVNHPDQYPDYVSLVDFSNTYGIKSSKLEYYIDEIVENNIYPIKFFKLRVAPDKNYYFQENEKLETMLRAITENHISKFTYLNKLFSRSVNLYSMVKSITEEICETLFIEDLKESLREFLPEYINYLAYKIEAKVELKETYDKLEGIIWQDMMDIFQSKNSGFLKDQYEEKIQEIDREIQLNPRNLDLFYSKIKLLMYFNQYKEVLKLLDKILEEFPEIEKDAKMKKASVHKQMGNIDAGLEIIDELIKKYPKDHDILNFKAYWYQYLNKKKAALEIVQQLIELEPNNGTYYDTFGEILMYFEEYENAIKKFEKTLEIDSSEWFIYQTYIKLGICHKELKNFEVAFENLEKGKELTTKSSIDPDTKQKWLTIADLFLAEIMQIED